MIPDYNGSRFGDRSDRGNVELYLLSTIVDSPD